MGFTYLQLLEENLMNIPAMSHISQSTCKYTRTFEMAAALDAGMAGIGT